MNLKVGDVVKISDSFAVVVALANDCIYNGTVPDDHVALWYGGIHSNDDNEVWTVPAEYCTRIEIGRIRH